MSVKKKSEEEKNKTRMHNVIWSTIKLKEILERCGPVLLCSSYCFCIFTWFILESSSSLLFHISQMSPHSHASIHQGEGKKKALCLITLKDGSRPHYDLDQWQIKKRIKVKGKLELRRLWYKWNRKQDHLELVKLWWSCSAERKWEPALIMTAHLTKTQSSVGVEILMAVPLPSLQQIKDIRQKFKATIFVFQPRLKAEIN